MSDADRGGAADRGRAAIWAGVAAGLAGLATFLLVHHLWIMPIWFIAPIGGVLAAVGGALVGAAYAELLPHLPRRPWTILAVMAVIALVLLPALVIAELTGPMFAMTTDGSAVLLVSAAAAVAAFVVGLLGTATVTGAVLGWAIGRTRRAAALMAGAGFALALGPGHNVPFLGASGVTGMELAILGAVVLVASVVLVEVDAWLMRSGGG